MGSKKIIKGNVFHSIKYNTCSKSTLLRYSFSLLIAGIIFLVVSHLIVSLIIQTTLSVIGFLLIGISIYLCPYCNIRALDNFFHHLRYILVCFLVHFFFLYFGMNYAQ